MMNFLDSLEGEGEGLSEEGGELLDCVDFGDGKKVQRNFNGATSGNMSQGTSATSPANGPQVTMSHGDRKKRKEEKEKKGKERKRKEKEKMKKEKRKKNQKNKEKKNKKEKKEK